MRDFTGTKTQSGTHAALFPASLFPPQPPFDAPQPKKTKAAVHPHQTSTTRNSILIHQRKKKRYPEATRREDQERRRRRQRQRRHNSERQRPEPAHSAINGCFPDATGFHIASMTFPATNTASTHQGTYEQQEEQHHNDKILTNSYFVHEPAEYPEVEEYGESDDDDDFRTISNQLYGEGSDEPFYYDRNSLLTPNVPYFHSLPVEEILKSPARITRNYVDPLIAVEGMLWLREDVGQLVESTLDRMGRAFAYNSVYTLKVVLDLQSVYRLLRPPVPESKLLSLDLVLKTAEVLSHRLTRRKKDNTALSRELQLRTLISALTLVSRLSTQKLACETYAQLLRDISEADADNGAIYMNEGEDAIKNGDNEYLTRYACDISRGLPTDMPSSFSEMNPEAIHWLFAAGFINQLEARPSRQTIDELFSRITAEPSPWYMDFRHMYESTVGSIAWQHQSKFSEPTKFAQFARPWALDIKTTLVERLEEELQGFPHNAPREDGLFEDGREPPESPPRESHMFICGMLDLLAQLVGAFPDYVEVVDDSVVLALEIIKRSHKQAFRSKALEIILCSTVGIGEDEYYETMRYVDSVIEGIAHPEVCEPQSEEEQKALFERVEQLKQEKRDAMERYEKKSALHTGAAESIQRRLCAQSNPENLAKSVEYVLQLKSQWNQEPRPISDVRSSCVPTLSSTSGDSRYSWKNGENPTPPPPSSACDTSADSQDAMASSPIDTCTCQRCSPGPVEKCDGCTCQNTSLKDPASAIEVPLALLPTPTTQTRQSGITLSLSGKITLPVDPTATLAAMQEDPDHHSHTLQQHSSYMRRHSGDSFMTMNSYNGGLNRRPSVNAPIPVVDPPDVDEYGRSYDISPRPPVSRSNTGTTDGSYMSSIAEGGGTYMDYNHLPLQSSETPSAPTPTSTTTEPSYYRPSSTSDPPPPMRRRSKLSSIIQTPWTKPRPEPQLDKPLPPLKNGDVAPLLINPSTARKKDRLAEHAPEVVPQKPMRSQSALDVRRQRPDVGTHTRNNSVFHSRRPPVLDRFTPLPTITDATQEFNPASAMQPDYESKPLESAYKLQTKDSSFFVTLSSDGRYAIYLSKHSFQVFYIPPPDQPVDKIPLFQYRLGTWEDMKKSKVPHAWEYSAAAASERYLVTMSKERIQVHDLEQKCGVIYNDVFKGGWESSAIAICDSKLAVGLSQPLARGERMGKIRLFRMVAQSPQGQQQGHRYELWGNDIVLPVNPSYPDAPQILNLSRDGNHLTCGTRKMGYYFAWDISRYGEARVLANSCLRSYRGPAAEVLTNVQLFPDTAHLLVTTFPAPTATDDTFGPYTESLYHGVHGANQRSLSQVSFRINTSSIAPHGKAIACVTKHGTVWTTPMVLGDDNLTSLPSTRSKERLMQMNTDNHEAPFGKVTFSGAAGERVVAADKKGKVLVLSFPLKPASYVPTTPPAPMLAQLDDILASPAGGYGATEGREYPAYTTSGYAASQASIPSSHNRSSVSLATGGVSTMSRAQMAGYASEYDMGNGSAMASHYNGAGWRLEKVNDGGYF